MSERNVVINLKKNMQCLKTYNDTVCSTFKESTTNTLLQYVYNENQETSRQGH